MKNWKEYMKAKIFIENDNTSFYRQMASFIIGCDDDNTVNFLFCSTVILNESFLNARKVNVLRFSSETLPALLSQVVDLLISRDFEDIELHMGLENCGRLLMPILGNYLKNINLHLYDSTVAGLVDRVKISSLTNKERAEAFFVCSEALKATLTKKNNTVSGDSWNPIFNYIPGDFVKTTYYVSNACPAAPDFFRAASKYSLFDEVVLDELQTIYYMQLCNIPLSLYAELKAVSTNDNSILYIPGTPAANYSESNYYAALHKEFSAYIKDNHHKYDNVIFKICNKNDNKNNEIVLSLGHNSICIDEEISLSALAVLNLLPHKVCGDINNDILYFHKPEVVFCIDNKSRATDIASHLLDLQWLIYNKIIHIDEYAEYSLAQPVRRYFYSHASMGDIVFAIGCINALRTSYTEEFVFVTNKLYSTLIDSSLLVDQFWDINNLSEKQLFELKIANYMGMLHNVGAWDHILAKKHLTDSLLDLFGKEYSPRYKHAVVNLDDSHIAKASDFIKKHNLQNARIVLLHPNIGAANRTWTEENWYQLTKYFLNENWKVVIIGSENNKHKNKKMMPVEIDGVIDATNQFSILETVALMQQCQLLVACDSGPVALAGMTDIAICALYSLIPAAWRLPYRHGKMGWNALGIDLSCQYGQCGKLIQDRKFFENVLNVPWHKLSSAEFSEWCPNGKTYSCLQSYS
ncbi:hypothetical protein D8M09_04720, partial [Enterobacter sp. R1(2018)]